MNLSIAVLIILGLITMICLALALGYAVHYLAKSQKSRQEAPSNKELDQQQADEITSTWTLLH